MWGSDGIDPCIINLGTRCDSVMNLTPPPWGLGNPQNWQNVLPLQLVVKLHPPYTSLQHSHWTDWAVSFSMALAAQSLAMTSSFLSFFDITHNDGPQSVGLLWTSDQPRRRDLYLTTHNTHNRQTSMPLGGIRTHNLSRRAAADLRLRPRGQLGPANELLGLHNNNDNNNMDSSVGIVTRLESREARGIFRFLQNVQTGCWVHPDSYSVLYGVKTAWASN